jgi:hypothetical protein
MASAHPWDVCNSLISNLTTRKLSGKQRIQAYRWASQEISSRFLAFFSLTYGIM